jgi:fumarate reductase subunit C
MEMKSLTNVTTVVSARTDARRQIVYELISGGSGLVLALFMWGHVVLVGSILTGERGFDWMATMLEDYYIAQPTVAAIFILFIIHAIFASRKIPAQLQERRRVIALAKGLDQSGREKVPSRRDNSPFVPHLESLLWIWQVRTGMVILVLGSFHLILLGIDVFTPLFGDHAGIESSTSTARVAAGLWLPYGILLLCVEFHAGVGLYRLAVKWGAGFLPHRRYLHRIEQVIFWVVLGLGTITLLVLAGWVSPPLEFLLSGGGA